MKEFDEADQARPGWEQVFQKYRVDWTILPANHRLNRVLELHPAWERAYGDETTLIFREDGTCYALARRDEGSRSALFGIAPPPYTEWTWLDTGQWEELQDALKRFEQ